jgi:tetratricopeptide (TPR) repeat protein
MVSSPPPAYLTYSMILYDFAKGLACLRKKDIKQASALCQSLDAVIVNDPELLTKDPLSPFSPKILPSKVAWNILQAEIYSASGNYQAAETQFNMAIQMEDSITYSEPTDWMLPARQYYGNCLLQWKRPADAEKIFRDDLVWNPGNGWSLTGLYLSLLAQQKNAEAAVYYRMATKSFSGSELKIKAPVF